MKKIKKHAAPLRCRLEVWLRGRSPSNCIICGIGARGCRKCKRCGQNRREIAAEAISAAFADIAETAQKAAQAFDHLSGSLPRIPQSWYELAEEEPEEEALPWPKKNPYIKKGD